VAAGDEAGALAGIADRLCAELGYPAEKEKPSARTAPPSEDPRHRLFATHLTAEQERLVVLARENLNRLGAALAACHPTVVSETTYTALLDGAETALRSEIASGVSVAEVMPSLVFLIALPMVSRDEALRLSQRTAALLTKEPMAEEGS
jgi:hypothetical protein